jgi:PTH1 family peptidyl-tRNA hydrolase
LAGSSPVFDSEQRGQQAPLLVVGLGNPGMEYVWTPHNAGFMAIDRIANQNGASVTNRRGMALTGITEIGGRSILLARPETFMNRSGLSVKALLEEFYPDDPDSGRRNLLVLYDELDLPLGTIKIRERGSPAGHNGARSITSSLGTEVWLRIRIGVGQKLSAEAIAAGAKRPGGSNYLLSPMRKADLLLLDEALDRVAQAVRQIALEGPAAAMNEWNRSA